jgi:TspO/MBR family
MDSSESNSSYGKAAYISFAVWIAISFVPALASVFVFTEDWFADLAKPSWNPPNWLFGPVWSALYLSMGIAAWLVWQQGGWVKQKQPLTLFLIQLVLNAIWTPLFFGLHRIDCLFVAGRGCDDHRILACKACRGLPAGPVSDVDQLCDLFEFRHLAIEWRLVRMPHQQG